MFAIAINVKICQSIHPYKIQKGPKYLMASFFDFDEFVYKIKEIIIK